MRGKEGFTRGASRARRVTVTRHVLTARDPGAAFVADPRSVAYILVNTSRPTGGRFPFTTK